MGRHSIPRGEKSSYGASNGSPRVDKKHEGKHREKETTTSDTKDAGPRDSRLRVRKGL